MSPIADLRAANTAALLATPGLADGIAVTVGNATFIPSDDPTAPWKALVIDVDGHDQIFFCTDTPPDRPKHVQQILPAMSFDAAGLAYLFRHCPPPIEFLHLLALDQERASRAVRADLH